MLDWFGKKPSLLDEEVLPTIHAIFSWMRVRAPAESLLLCDASAASTSGSVLPDHWFPLPFAVLTEFTQAA